MRPPCSPCTPSHTDPLLGHLPAFSTAVAIRSGKTVRQGSVRNVPRQIDASGISLRRCWGRFLSGYSWDHYVTLTVDSPRTSETLKGMFRRGFARNLDRDAQCKVSFFLAIEGESLGFAHVHALIGGTKDVPVATIQRHWKFGYTSVRTYNPRRGAAHYVVKEFGRPSSTWEDYDLELPPHPHI